MAVNERRKRQRNSQTIDGSIFIEIHHTFGSQKKSIFKIIDLDDYGLSFLVPSPNGYFTVGTPLQYDIVKSDLSRSKGSGFVRYYKPHYDESGTLLHKIGLEISSTFRDIPVGKYAIRPPRYKLDGGPGKQSVRFFIGGVEYCYPLIDVSRYSAAFKYDGEDAAFFRVSMVLNDADIYINDNVIYHGPLTVNKIYQDKNQKHRIIVEPRNQAINVEIVEHHESVQSALKESAVIIKSHEAFSGIDTGFKAAVAELRVFLEEYKRLLESPYFQNISETGNELTAGLFKDFYSRIDVLTISINNIVTGLNLSDELKTVYKSFYQKQLLHLLLIAPVNKRSYFKPEGYPGDYEIMRLVNENTFEGNTLFSKLMHKYSTESAVGETVRKRTEYLGNNICSFVEKNSNPTVEIFSIASGPALEIDWILKNRKDISNKMSLTLLDQEINALRFSQDNLYESRIKSESEMPLNFVHQTIGSYFQSLLDNTGHPKYDYIYAFGLFDYFESNVASFTIKRLLEQLEKGGRLVISNMSLDNYKYKVMMEFGLDWYLVYRDRNELLALTKGLKGSFKYTIDEIEGGIMKFLIIDT